MRARLAELPELPGKVGFIIDAGPSPIVMDASGDFRIERTATGTLALRGDGRSSGVAVTRPNAVDALIRLAHWFSESGGCTAGRMTRHKVALPDWAQGDAVPASGKAMQPGAHPIGAVYGLPFGRIDAALLAAFVRSHGCALRLTPWRLLIAEGVAPALSPTCCSPTARSCTSMPVSARPPVRRRVSKRVGWPSGSHR
ncbi:hypothetical protein GCM10020258_06200 [Sphingomonas yabuuchiae]